MCETSVCLGQLSEITQNPRVELNVSRISALLEDAVVARMTPEQIRPAVISWVKSLEAATTDAPDRVVNVDDEELDRFANLGWEILLGKLP